MRLVTLFVSCVLVASACERPPASDIQGDAAITPSFVSLYADYSDNSRDYQITWETEPEVPVRIEVSSDPEAAPGSGFLLADKLAATGFTWYSSDSDARHYFIVTPERGSPQRIAPRVLPLEGGRNFRDLGGYVSTDGKHVKWGKLYRSGVMHKLTDADYRYLSGLGIRVICDLRTSQERSSEPTEWRGGESQTLTFQDPPAGDFSAFASVFTRPDVTPEDVRGVMIGMYREILVQQGPAYREMFSRLAAGEVPLAFHCSAGKDRTGVGAALILAALGVPDETIISDYVLSDQIVDYRAQMQLDEAGGAYAFLAQLPPDLVAPLLQSEAVYIEAAITEAKQTHGSLVEYIKAEYDVSDATLASIRASLTE